MIVSCILAIYIAGGAVVVKDVKGFLLEQQGDYVLADFEPGLRDIRGYNSEMQEYVRQVNENDCLYLERK